MLNINEYLPIGSVVLLRGGIKKAMIIGIIQSTQEADGLIKEHDYIGVMFPEGFLNAETMFMFDHNQITDVVYRGYENPERKEFLEALEKNIAIAKEVIEKQNKEDTKDVSVSSANALKTSVEDIF